MFSGEEGIKNPHFLELDSGKGMPKTVAKDTVTDVLSSKLSWSGVYSSVTAPPNAVSGEGNTPNSMQSSSAVASNCLDTALIDLKLGRFPDKKDVQFTDNPTFSSAQSSVPRKRARAGNSNSQTPFCKVEGCQKDLSASKDYNKRHKVCEVHSKTAKVYVNGTEQRFCQQCSRFHSLVEFDDGKRSCRKRLAGHNERRRKHHTVHPSRRLIPSYNGIKFPGSSFAATSFVCPDAPNSSHLLPQRHEVSNWNRNPTDYADPLGIGNLKGKAPIKSHTDFDSLSLYQNTPVGSEELTVMDSSSSFHGLPPSSNSTCALSLLSCQSQTSPYISSSIPRPLPLIPPTSHSHYSMVQVSQTSTSGVSNVFPTSSMTSADETHMDSLLFTDSMGSDKFGYNEFITGSTELMSTKNQLSTGDDSTIDLLELSSQLHHVEHERQSMQMKQQNDPFFGHRIT